MTVQEKITEMKKNAQELCDRLGEVDEDWRDYVPQKFFELINLEMREGHELEF